MPVAFTLSEFEYVLECDREQPEDRRTRFRLRQLGTLEKGEVERLSFSQRGDEIYSTVDRIGKAVQILNYGLLGWDNFHGPTGPIKFAEVKQGDKRTLPPHVLDAIQPWIIELANAVTEHSALSEQTSKNS